MTTMEQPATPTSTPPPAIQQRVPREVSAGVRWSLRLGGGVGVVGWGVLAFGMIFFWVFVMNADVASLWQFDGETERATGQVTRCEKTKFTIGGGKSSRRKPVYANSYVFIADDGTERRGVSFATNEPLGVRQVVEVEYPKWRPDVSRIVGMRRAPLPGLTALVALLPAVGLGLVVASFRRGSRHAHLLENGRLAWGRMASKEATSARVNRKTVYKMTFEFTADNRRTYQAVAKTHATEELEDEEHELVLYEPGDPRVAVVADGLPAGVRVDEKGRVHQKVPVLVWLLLPMMTLIGHGTYACTRYL